MKYEAKVGFVVILGLALLMGVISFLGVFKFSSDNYTVDVIFKRAGGLKPDDIVQFVGVPVGKVEKVAVEGSNVRVKITMKNDIKIPKGSSFLLGSSGMMGTSYIDIEPPSVEGSEYIGSGDTVVGYQGSSVADVMQSANDVLGKLNIMADTVNSLLSDEDVKNSIKQTISNTQEITNNINDMTRIFSSIAIQNQDELNQMVLRLSSMADHMNNVASRMDRMLLEVDNNGQTSQDIVNALHNLKEASENVEKITKSIEGLTGDPNVQQDIRETLKNAREASDKANKMLGSFGGGMMKTSLDFKYGDKPDKYRVDANLQLNYTPKKFLVLGVAGIGEENDLNLQLGRNFNNTFAMRAGIILGDVGTGVDVNFAKRFKLSTDFYDPNDLKIRVAGEWRLNDYVSLVAESLDVRKKASDSTYVGVKGYF